MHEVSRKVVTVVKRSPCKAETIDTQGTKLLHMPKLLGRDRITHPKDP